jgi:hypothetical protein
VTARALEAAPFVFRRRAQSEFLAGNPRRSASQILARLHALIEFGEGRDTHVLSFALLLRALSGSADANAALTRISRVPLYSGHFRLRIPIEGSVCPGFHSPARGYAAPHPTVNLTTCHDPRQH